MAGALYFTSFVWMIVSSLAAPVSNTTSSDAEPGWKSQPKGRGTFGIILSSVLTLGLCVWTAIHPNVHPSASTGRRLKTKLSFVVVGMLAPEIILAVAFYEWREARKFHGEWCKIYGVDAGKKGDFVTMGGVTLLPPHSVPKSLVYNTLSPEGYLELARTKDLKGEVSPSSLAGREATGEAPDLIQAEHKPPRLSMKKEFVNYWDVQDKGKAEMLGKTLVCIQAVWMLIQCIVRKASGLPVTLLEIHVAMHVICAIGMYAFWFNKPQDVGEPINTLSVIDEDQAHVEVVWRGLLWDNWYPDNNSHVRIRLSEKICNDLVRSKIVEPAHCHRIRVTPKNTVGLGPDLVDWRVRFLGCQGEKEETRGAPDLVVPFGHGLDLGAIQIGYDDPNPGSPGNYINCSTINMPPDDLAFIKRAADAMNAGKQPLLSHECLVPRIGVLSGASSPLFINISNCLPGIAIPLIYGACHAAAWNTHFPSPEERLLWRVSSVVIGAVPAYAILVLALHNSDYKTLRDIITCYVLRLDTDHWPWGMGWFVIFILIAPLLAVVVGRLYLFTESFASLRSLPRGSFDSTPWEDYWPHF